MAPKIPTKKTTPLRAPSHLPESKPELVIHKAESHMTPIPTPRAAQPAAKLAPPVVPRSELAATATTALLLSLFKEAGVEGTLLDHPTGQSFTLSKKFGDGAVHSNHAIFVPLTDGRSVRHEANLVAELEDGRILFVDVLDGHESLERAKALGFDALHLRNGPKKVFGCLVFVRPTLGALQQGQVEAIGHGYHYVFGIDEHDVPLGIKFAACQSEILKWIRRRTAA